MLLTKTQKQQLVSEMSDSLTKLKTLILINYQGLKVKEIQEVKKKLKKDGIGFQIVKNSLLKIALKKANLTVNDDLLNQPIAVVWGLTDEVTPAKTTVEFDKLFEKLEIVGGIVNGSFVDVPVIKQLAALPSREELYAKLVGTLNAPMYRLVNALQGNLRSLVYILDQYKNSK